MKYLSTVILITLMVTAILSFIFGYTYYEMEVLTEAQREFYNVCKVLFSISSLILLWHFIMDKVEDYRAFKGDKKNKEALDEEQKFNAFYKKYYEGIMPKEFQKEHRKYIRNLSRKK